MDLPQEALARFRESLVRAQRLRRLREPTAMQLATADAQGAPSLRTVLLKGADERGFVFYTNSRSRKGRQLAHHPLAALNFYWDALGRQVTAEGRVQPLADAESDAYWATRSRASQIGAWASLQSRPLEKRSHLLARVAAYTAKFSGKPIPRPRHWRGYRLMPHRIEFWDAKPFRLHERTVYELRAGSWIKSLLFP